MWTNEDNESKVNEKQKELDEIKHKFDDLLIQSNSGDIEKDNAIDELNKLAEEQESKIKELEEELQTRKEKKALWFKWRNKRNIKLG